MERITEQRKSHMTRRIVITGSECTGKTTLAMRIASHFGAPCVPEYSRQYALAKEGTLLASDVEPIAKGQMSLEDEYSRDEPDLLILDTDLLSTVVYSHHYYGSCPPWIEQECSRRLGSLYLLLYPDVPWIADGIRDRGDRREELHALFVRALKRFHAHHIEIRGAWEERQRKAIAVAEALS